MNKKGVRTFLPFVLMGVIIMIIALIFIFNFAFKGNSSSAVNEYKITGYDVEINVNEDNSLDIKEKIDVNFLVKSHGIFRQIPIYQTISFSEQGKNYNKNYKTIVSSVQCSSHNYDFYTDNSNYVIQLGSSSVYAGVNETYEINYKISLGDDKIPEFDQFYYNVVGNQWDTTVSNINVTINFLKPVDDREITFYAMTPEGEKTFVENISGSTVNYTYSGTLEPFSGITARTVLEEGYFNPTKQVITGDIVVLLVSIALMVIGTVIFLIKNNKNKIIPVVEFSAPEGITPADAGYIIDKTINNGDISSLIIYWASKGFIKIVENGNSTTLEKLKDADETFKVYEKSIFDAMFGSNTSYNIDSENINVANALQLAKEGVKFENERFFNQSISSLRYFLIGIFAVMCGIMYWVVGQKVSVEFYSLLNCFFISLLLFCSSSIMLICLEKRFTIGKFTMIVSVSFAIIVQLGIYIASAIFLFDMYANPLLLTVFVPLILSVLNVLALKTNYRVEGENKQVGRVFGLRDFIIHTEKDRIKVLAEDKPELFFDILPYAYVLGISGVWISKFKEIEIKNPTWYQSSTNVLNIYIGLRLLSSINSVNINASRALVKTNSSGKIGKGGSFGGGHSGGGFGGGGGGRW